MYILVQNNYYLNTIFCCLTSEAIASASATILCGIVDIAASLRPTIRVDDNIIVILYKKYYINCKYLPQ